MRVHFSVCVFLFFLSFLTCAQETTGEGSIMKILAQAPDSSFRSASSFAHFIRTRFSDDEEILTAIYIWVAKSVSYDVENMYSIHFEENPGELIEKTFQTKKAICQGYAELFNDLCKRSGIQSYVVHGYTKQHGKIQNTGHAWIIASAGKGWFGFDPTWGAGYVNDGRFTKSFTWEYFMVSPEILILSHMPFDPMWQCLDYPVSIKDFYSGELTAKENGNFFNYSDSISSYEQLTVIDQYEITLKRIEQNGIINPTIRDYASYLKQTIENDRQMKLFEYHVNIVEKLNEAAGHYNQAANLFNQYINFFNRQFKPSVTDLVIRQMIDTCDAELIIAKEIISRVDPFDNQIRENAGQLTSVVRELQYIIDKQKEFVIIYLATPEGSREALFRSPENLGSNRTWH
jgi:transglutaminase/protease-like cytokinesis protein 3